MATSRVAVPDSFAVAKPLTRGWSHAAASLWALGLTITLCLRARADTPRLISVAIFGLTMIELYSVSALYHIGSWRPAATRRLRSLDHANIFLLIAGTYTPLCVNILSGWARAAMLVTIWLLAILGVGLAVVAPDLPRKISASLYIGMGWVAVLALPAFTAALHWPALLTLLAGGVLYTLGGLVYAWRWPNPSPRVFGFHEVFHLFVIAGGLAFAAVVWFWVIPFVRP